MLIVIDEYSRECLSIHIQRQIKAPEVLYKLSELFIAKGVPDHIRSDKMVQSSVQNQFAAG
jgi:putative transposase